MNRAYSILTVKAFDDEKRTFTGIATTPTPDSYGDVVEPDGAEFKLPIPFLWQHNSREPIGWITKAKVKAGGIEIEGMFAKIEDPGKLKDRLDEAWQSVKIGLVRGLSIGFSVIEYARIDGAGYRFLKWLWLELSAVTIPANQDCSIQAIKSADLVMRGGGGEGGTGGGSGDRTKQQDSDEAAPAAIGTGRVSVAKGGPGAAGKGVKLNPRQEAHPKMSKKTYGEQIANFEATRAAKAARMDELMEKASDEGRTLDEAETEEYDGLEAEVKSVDAHLVRLRALEASNKAKAAPVNGATAQAASDSRGGVVGVQLKAKVEPGVRFARFARCLALAHKQHRDINAVAQELYGERDPEVLTMVKAAGTAVSAMTTSNMSSLIGNEGGFADFVEFLRARTVVGRFGNNGIPALRAVPFRVPLVGQATGGSAWWVGEGAGKPLTKITANRSELDPLKIATIAVTTMELLRDSSPSAEKLIRDDLAAAVIEREDVSFIDPTNAGSANISPASITNGLTPVTSSGSTADAVRADVKAAMTKFITAKNPITSGVWVMGSATALALSLMVNALGQPEFPKITLNGGEFFGLPVITTEFITDYVVLMNATDVYLGDEGGLDLAMSTEASLQMVGADDQGATVNAATPTAVAMVSMFQTNSVAFRAERTVSWKRRRETGVTYIEDVTWGAEAGSP